MSWANEWVKWAKRRMTKPIIVKKFNRILSKQIGLRCQILAWHEVKCNPAALIKRSNDRKYEYYLTFNYCMTGFQPASPDSSTSGAFMLDDIHEEKAIFTGWFRYWLFTKVITVVCCQVVFYAVQVNIGSIQWINRWEGKWYFCFRKKNYLDMAGFEPAYPRALACSGALS